VTVPSGENSCVIPTFLPMMPVSMAVSFQLSAFSSAGSVRLTAEG